VNMVHVIAHVELSRHLGPVGSQEPLLGVLSSMRPRYNTKLTTDAWRGDFS
jgi:hypothetical protein